MKKIAITQSPQGKKLKKPILLEIAEPKTQAEENLHQFILETFATKGTSVLAKFTFENVSMMEIAKHLLFHRTGSQSTLANYVYDIYGFSKWSNTTPDQLLSECVDDVGVAKAIGKAKTTRLLENYSIYLRAERNLAPATARNMIKAIQRFFSLNGATLKLRYNITKWALYEHRAPSPEEIQKALKVADMREKTIISVLASSGLRVGTLVKLQYGHVKYDLERQVYPIHVHIKAEISKGMYHEYDTFLNHEAAKYLDAYFEERRNGTGRLHPERIVDESPLICQNNGKYGTLARYTVSEIVHNVYVKAGLIQKFASARRYEICAHSLRSFFRSELAFLGVNRDCIEYMMGHKISSYVDVKVRGFEFLRSVYSKSCFSLQPLTRENKVNALKEIARAWGLNTEEVLSSEYLSAVRTPIVRNEKKPTELM